MYYNTYQQFTVDADDIKGVEYDNHFQIQYANSVVKLEILNRSLTDVLLNIQHAENIVSTCVCVCVS